MRYLILICVSLMLTFPCIAKTITVDDGNSIVEVLYNITDLGTLPDGSASGGWAINNNGQIVGYAAAVTEWHAVLFDPTGSGNNIDLGTLAGDIGSFATSINDAGQIVGYSRNDSDEASAVLFDSTGAANNIDLDPSGTDNSYAWSINDSGQIVGQAETVLGRHATLFDPTGAGNNIDLDPLGSHSSSALSINDHGQIVGWGYQHAMLFDPTGDGNNIDLGNLGGYAISTAYSINNSGQIVGAADAGTEWHAVLFDPTGDGNNIDLGTLGGNDGKALSINNRGQIVGSAKNASGAYRATLFDPTGAGDNVDLNALIDPNLGWTLTRAQQINDDGWIVGSGFNPQGYPRAFLLTPMRTVIEAEMNFTPHAVNCHSKGKWVKAHIVLPEEIYPEDIDVNTPAIAEPVGAESEYIEVFDNVNGQFDLQIYFDRQTFCETVPDTNNGFLDVTVTGFLLDGREFQATDTIKLQNKF